MKNLREFRQFTNTGNKKTLIIGESRAIFVTGGPGSGKDVIIREVTSQNKICEMNHMQAYNHLADKKNLVENLPDFYTQVIKNRMPLIINVPADDIQHIAYIKEELEELGYSTMMVFVNTTNRVSRERNEKLSRMMNESVRLNKWIKAQKNLKIFEQVFSKIIFFDNTAELNHNLKDIREVYKQVRNFLNESINSINIVIENKEITNANKNSKSIQRANLHSKGCGKHQLLADNNCPACQMLRKSGKIDDVRDGDVKSNPGGYIFRTYESTGRYSQEEQSQPTLKWNAPPKEPNFSYDKDKEKKIRKGNTSLSAARVGRPDGIGATFSTRTSGQGLTGGAGLGNTAFGEERDKRRSGGLGQEITWGQRGSAQTAGPRPGNNFVGEKKNFQVFRKEAIDDPGIGDSGVGGVLGGAGNREGMDSYKDVNRNIGIIINRKKRRG